MVLPRPEFNSLNRLQFKNVIRIQIRPKWLQWIFPGLVTIHLITYDSEGNILFPSEVRMSKGIEIYYYQEREDSGSTN